MKKLLISTLVVLLSVLMTGNAQEVQSLFNSPRPSGGYVALSNKFTTIKGQYANVCELYGGWFIKKRFLLGVGVAASTNNIQVPFNLSIAPLRDMSWQYAQAGLQTEYVFASNRVMHFNFTMFAGGGFTMQHERPDIDEWDDYDYDEDLERDENLFTVIEPGIQLELNVFKWMRLSPGVSYRKTFGSDGIGLTDDDLSDMSYNISLKFGKF